MSAEGKVVLVTGGARNMGFHAAAGLVRRGAKVAILARGREAVEEAAQALGGDVLPIAAEVTDPAQIAEALRQTAERFGGIDGIVNNAGVAYPNAIEKLDEAQVREQTAVNFLAPIFAARAVIPYLRQRGGGRIVNISSATTRAPGSFGHLSIYGATKAGLEYFTEQLRHEVQKDNIAVTCFIPGDTSTGFGRAWAPEAVQAAYADWLDQGPYWNGMMPVEVVGEEIAHMFDLPNNVTFEVTMLRPVGQLPKTLEGE
ncbi:SDR family NAD(P)-dependent oxidoreductase [Caenibius sp. WL]|uniref:SDR family oxidoreductase n=1 Tax=Caenibius sp. WL TaxID=2872646 RepID=UPI001C99ECDB|nr:SDR family NAD(P)-dependent oxidoreductase [Caenibius sp. WL]QZP09167.1 SDR family NAD(P)-dependent oxidoreductase [Caenibius sp. WL]